MAETAELALQTTPNRKRKSYTREEKLNATTTRMERICTRHVEIIQGPFSAGYKLATLTTLSSTCNFTGDSPSVPE